MDQLSEPNCRVVSVFGPPSGADVCRPVTEPIFGGSPRPNASISCLVLSASRSSYKSSFTWMTGAFTHAPTHSTSVIVNSPSVLVSPQPFIPVAARQTEVTSSEPRNQHGVGVHTCKCHLPTGLR